MRPSCHDVFFSVTLRFERSCQTALEVRLRSPYASRYYALVANLFALLLYKEELHEEPECISSSFFFFVIRELEYLYRFLGRCDRPTSRRIPPRTRDRGSRDNSSVLKLCVNCFI